jgi:hypothetical protein
VGGGWLGLLTLMLCLVPPTVLVGVLVTYIIALLDWYADLPKAKPLGEYLSRVAQQTNPLSVLMSTQIEDLRKWAGQRTRAASEGEPEDLPKKSEKPLLTPTESAQNRFFRPKGDTAN